MESIKFQPNSPGSLQILAQNGILKRDRVYFALAMRTLFFLLIGALFVSLFYLLGNDNALKEAVAWWPYQVILGNMISFIFLKRFCKEEAMGFWDLFGFEKHKLQKDLLLVLPILLAGGVIGGLGMLGSSFLIFGTTPPATMFQPLPTPALWVAVVLLPITNSIVETTTYMGYALPRLEGIFRNKRLPLVLAAFFLALQHIAFPLIPEPDFILWRIVSTLPTAFLVGFIYMKMRRLLPLVIVHFLMDLQLMLTYFQIQ